MIIDTVPHLYMSSGAGSSCVMSLWVDVKTSLSFERAASTALMDFSLPTKSGTIIKGKMTTSLMGTSGRTSGITSCSSSNVLSSSAMTSLFRFILILWQRFWRVSVCPQPEVL